MRNEADWVPSKFTNRDGSWRATNDSTKLAVSSRITSDAAVKTYEYFCDTYAKGHLLELGCGRVPLYGMYRDKVISTTTVDWSSSMHGMGHVDIVADLGAPTDLPSNRFDTVVSTSVVEHIRNPHVFFREISRVLAPDGVAMIATPFYYPLHEVPYDFFRITKYGLRYLSEEHGLSVIELIEYGGLPEIFADLVSKLLAKPHLLSVATVTFLQWLLRMNTVRNVSRATAHRFPLGYTLVVKKTIGN